MEEGLSQGDFSPAPPEALARMWFVFRAMELPVFQNKS